MGITKTPPSPPFTNEPKPSRRKEIESALQNLPALGPAELRDFAVKLTYAAANGIIQLTSQELTALKTIAQKSIPDAPKQINLNAKVQTEQVILTWLNNNQKNLGDTNRRIRKQSVIESKVVTSLQGFAETFSTEEEEDGG